MRSVPYILDARGHMHVHVKTEIGQMVKTLARESFKFMAIPGEIINLNSPSPMASYRMAE